MKIIAVSKEDLISKLSAIDISAPLRCEGGTNEQIERWSMFRLLATLCERDGLIFPLELTKDESPDYVLQMDSSKYGFEITVGISEEYAEALSCLDKKEDGALVELQSNKWTGKKKKKRKGSEPPGRPYVGDEVEREYAQLVLDVTNKKTFNMRKRGYQLFQQNNLIIYCEQGLPYLNQEKAVEFCHEKMQGYWGKSTSFDNVYVKASSVKSVGHFRRG